jgi:hypothetical protein
MVPAIPRRSKPHRDSDAHARQSVAGRAALLAVALLVATPSVTWAAPAPEEALSGPDIVIIAEEERTIYEFRQGGELRMVRIEPRFGKPYYLVPRDPTRGFGDLERADMLLPSWVIMRF